MGRGLGHGMGRGFLWASIFTFSAMTAGAQAPEVAGATAEEAPRAAEVAEVEIEQAEPFEGEFGETVTVSLSSATVRIVTRRGDPVLGLGTEDLVATVGRQPVEIVGVDWVGPETSTVAGTSPALSPLAFPDRDRDAVSPLREIEPPPEEGRLVVLFVQIGHHMVVTLEPTIVRGHMRLLPALRRMARGFSDADWIAVASFDSKLELWLDFTRDREAVAKALWDAIGFADAEPRRNLGGPSLFPAYDLEAARGVTSTGEALGVLARALEPLPGTKDIVYSGWGVSHTGGILSALARAETVVSVLDVTQADAHLLGASLEWLAEATGGTYAATFNFPRSKVERLERALVGHYLVTFDTSSLGDRGGRLQLRYPADPEVRVLYRKRTLRPGR